MAKPATALQLTERAPAAALVMALGDRRALDGFFAERFGLPLPPAGKRIERGGHAALFVAPGKWLLLGDRGSDGFVPALAQGLKGIAAITDQSDGFRTFRLSGPGATDLLQTNVAIDLHETRFPRGSATATMIGLMRVHLSRIDDAPTYELSVARSLADSLVSHLLDQGAGRGCAYSPLPHN